MTKGFTLLEMLVALAVTSVLMLGVLGMAGRMGQAVQRNEEILQQDMAIFSAISQFEKDILSYYSNMSATSPSELQFISLKQRAKGQHGSGFVQITYHIERTPEGLSRMMRQEVDPLYANERLNSEILVAQDIHFTLRTTRTQDKSPWIDESEPPAAVSLHINNDQNRVWVRTAPVLVRTP